MRIIIYNTVMISLVKERAFCGYTMYLEPDGDPWGDTSGFFEDYEVSLKINAFKFFKIRRK